jgi:signal transduction histidine kinase
MAFYFRIPEALVSMTIINNIKYLIPFICTFFFFIPAFSMPDKIDKKIDSLEVSLILNDEVKRVEILLSLNRLYIKKNPQLAFNKAEQAYELANKLENNRLKVLSLEALGMTYQGVLADYDRALEHCFEALKLAEYLKDISLQAFVLFSIGNIYEEAGDNLKALEQYLKAAVLEEKVDTGEKLIKIYQRLGIVNSNLSDFLKAHDYLFKAIRLSRDLANKSEEASSLYWLGESNRLGGSLDEAFKNHLEALKLRREIKETATEGSSLNKIGTIYRTQGNLNRALDNHKAALGIHKKNQNLAGLAESNNSIGEILMEKKSYNEALNFLKEGLKHSENSNSKYLLKTSYENLYTCNLGLGDISTALYYMNNLEGINSLIYNEENSRKMAEMESRYEMEKKEGEIKLLIIDRELQQVALEKEKNFRYFLFIFSGLTIVIALLLFYLYKLNKKNNLVLKATNEKIASQNHELQELNATKDKFFSIIAHDMKGPLNSLTTFSKLLIHHSGSLTKEELEKLAKDLDQSLKNLFAFLENLLEWARSQTGAIDYKPQVINLKEITNNCLNLLQRSAENKSITLTESVDESMQVLADKNQILTVLRNFISNAIKFTNQKGLINVTAREVGDTIQISVMDTGVGMSKEVLAKLFHLEHKHSTKGTANEKGTGLGLILCKEFVEKNKGIVTVESVEGKGSTFRFTLPKAESLEEILIKK